MTGSAEVFDPLMHREALNCVDQEQEYMLFTIQ